MLDWHPDWWPMVWPWAAQPVRPMRFPAEQTTPKAGASEPLSEMVAAHLDAVWLAVGAASFLGGVTFVTAGWLGHVALVVASPTFNASTGDEVFSWFCVGVGVFFFAGSLYIFRAFFRASRLPRTLRQREDEEAKTRARSRPSATVAAKGTERWRGY